MAIELHVLVWLPSSIFYLVFVWAACLITRRRVQLASNVVVFCFLFL